jgi:hypothetical protein
MALVSIRAGHFNLTLQVDYALVGEIPLGSRLGYSNGAGLPAGASALSAAGLTIHKPVATSVKRGDFFISLMTTNELPSIQCGKKH